MYKVIETMQKDIGNVQHRCETHLREAGEVSAQITNLTGWLKRIDQKLDTIIRNGGGHKG